MSCMHIDCTIYQKTANIVCFIVLPISLRNNKYFKRSFWIIPIVVSYHTKSVKVIWFSDLRSELMSWATNLVEVYELKVGSDPQTEHILFKWAAFVNRIYRSFIFVQVYNLLEFSLKKRKKKTSLCNYYTFAWDFTHQSISLKAYPSHIHKYTNTQIRFAGAMIFVFMEKNVLLLHKIFASFKSFIKRS